MKLCRSLFEINAIELEIAHITVFPLDEMLW